MPHSILKAMSNPRLEEIQILVFKLQISMFDIKHANESRGHLGVEAPGITLHQQRMQRKARVPKETDGSKRRLGSEQQVRTGLV